MTLRSVVCLRTALNNVHYIKGCHVCIIRLLSTSNVLNDRGSRYRNPDRKKTRPHTNQEDGIGVKPLFQMDHNKGKSEYEDVSSYRNQDSKFTERPLFDKKSARDKMEYRVRHNSPIRPLFDRNSGGNIFENRNKSPYENEDALLRPAFKRNSGGNIYEKRKMSPYGSKDGLLNPAFERNNDVNLYENQNKSPHGNNGNLVRPTFERNSGGNKYDYRNRSPYKNTDSPSRPASERNRHDYENALLYGNEDFKQPQKCYVMDPKESQEEVAAKFKPDVDPEKTSVLLFPGQGSQFVGMGKELLKYPGVSDLYEEASEVLGYDLLDICVNGPPSKLDRTLFCQPSIFVTSLAACKKLVAEYPESLNHISAIAGFSVGEITALVMGGVLSFADGLQLIRLRALAQQEASEAEQGGMATVFLGGDSKLLTGLMAAREFCRLKMDITEPVCQVAIHLSINVKVIGGHEPALEFISKYGKEWEIKDVKPLPVSGAFHTILMQQGENYYRFKKFLQKLTYQTPSAAVWANSDLEMYNAAVDTKRKILLNYLKPVQWEQTMHKIYTRPPDVEFPNTYEVGPGKQLGWVLYKINKKAYSKYKNITV